MDEQGNNKLYCTLFGSATQNIKENVVTLTCNLTKGTNINNDTRTISAKLEITLNEADKPTNINVIEAIFGDIKINGLSEILNKMITQS